MTGATGFLGRHLVDALRRRGHTVRAVHRRDSQLGFPSDVELAELDLRASAGVAEALDGIDLVVHAAAAKTGDLHDQFAGTVATTEHLLTGMRAAGVERIVLVSSFSVYDALRIPPGAVLHEASPTRDPATARDAYSITKRLQEELVEEAATAAGWSAVIARPGAIYGPEHLWTARLGYQRDHRAWVCIGSRAPLPMTYVANAADAIAHLAERPTPGIRRVNIVDDDPPTQREYRRQLIRRLGRPEHMITIPWPVVRLTVGLLTGGNRVLGGPLLLPGALRQDAAVARWQPNAYPNRRLHGLGWHQPMPWPETLDASVVVDAKEVADPERINAGGTALDLLEREDLLERVLQRLGDGDRPLVIASANLDHLSQFGVGAPHSDPVALSGDIDWLVTADGTPLVAAARVMTKRPWPKLAGSDLLPDILDAVSRRGATIGFVGGRPEQHERLPDILAAQFPQLRVGGFWSPTRDELLSPHGASALAEEVADAGVDVLVVGLGKPRQELWIAEHLPATGAKVALAFGAAADFLAGITDRAPEAWQRLGLEWLYRLIQEPRRLWHRYLVEGPVSVVRLLRRSRR